MNEPSNSGSGQLAAVRFADIVGYSQLMAADEERAAARILEGWRGAQVSPMDAVGQLELGRLAARRGDRARAVAAYRHVANAWVRGDPRGCAGIPGCKGVFG